MADAIPVTAKGKGKGKQAEGAAPEAEQPAVPEVAPLVFPHEAPPPQEEQLAEMPAELAEQAKAALDAGARSVYAVGGILGIQH